MTPSYCEYCGSGALGYKGIDDDVELWECADCESIIEVEIEDWDDFEETDRPSPRLLTDDDIADIPF